MVKKKQPNQTTIPTTKIWVVDRNHLAVLGFHVAVYMYYGPTDSGNCRVHLEGREKVLFKQKDRVWFLDENQCREWCVTALQHHRGKLAAKLTQIDAILAGGPAAIPIREAAIDAPYQPKPGELLLD